MADDPVDKFLTEQKTLEAHRHELIKEVLRQKEAAIKVFDDKLAKLGYDGEHAVKAQPSQGRRRQKARIGASPR